MDNRADMGADDDADGRWLGYGELAALRGIDRTSALKLALRNKWRKQKDNHGQVRVYVPAEFLAAKDKSTSPGAAPAMDMSMVTSAFAAAVTSLTARAEAAEASAKQARADADAATRRAEVEAARASTAEAALATERTALAERSAAWRRLGRLARLRRAWGG